ncbi:hypothetical protein BJY00DRAFT_288392 [Aspergillus carlsbadensis]|nr:hypothetical protein BJY00DRAFT_288392 [Aspergillus carlsbadensis]
MYLPSAQCSSLIYTVLWVVKVSALSYGKPARIDPLQNIPPYPTCGHPRAQKSGVPKPARGRSLEEYQASSIRPGIARVTQCGHGYAPGRTG